MALNIQKLGTRALTALFFVLVLLGCLLWNYYSFSILFFVVAMWGLHEFFNLVDQLGFRAQRAAGFAAGVLTYASFVAPAFLFKDRYTNLCYLFLPAVPFMLLAFSVFDKHKSSLINAVLTITGLVYAVLPFGLLHLLVLSEPDRIGDNTYQPLTLIGIILLIWSNDTFAYLGGSVFGKHKMIERVSPGKTWEGTIIGVLVTFGLSFTISDLLYIEDSIFWPVAGFLVPVVATVGDLLESILKRQAGVKDTGNIMPGHGGILDRFDSLIFVSPFVVVALKLISVLSVSGL